MAELTKEYFKEYLDQKLEERTDAILSMVKQGFDEQTERLNKQEESLTTLTNSVDRFVKIMEDLKLELIVLRKQLKDIEQRVDQLETIKTT
ncbi:MAG: hypothetical protein V1838_01965 [Patescibacteria group bacterium]